VNILEKIVFDKQKELAARKAETPLSSFRSNCVKSDRSVLRSLDKGKELFGAGYILEVKQASPSKGLIRPNFDLDEICEAYKPYASVVSVLTDEKYFSGNFERVSKVRNKVSQPILCKDFFVDEYQIYLARYYGADAILLMLSVLDDDTYLKLATIAKELSLDILTEVSNESEMHRAIKLNANIIGINNRNLRDLSTVLHQTPKLVKLFQQVANEKQLVETKLISESGIYSHQQAKALARFVDGFLVGSSLMAQDDIGQACHTLINGEHKVCGITSIEDADKAIKQGADYLGFIFVKDSPRYMTKEKTNNIIKHVRSVNSNIKTVAVVKNNDIVDLIALIQTLKVDAIQLHGVESLEYIQQLNDAIADHQDIEIWKALSINIENDQIPKTTVLQNEALYNTLTTYIGVADKVLLDSKSNGKSGGTGKAFDWEILNTEQILGLTLSNELPLMLAGGINPNNILRALTLPVAGLDINSGVEDSPGNKSEILLTRVFERINKKFLPSKAQLNDD
jgi:indole-3-glycerol phosphate synthase / phosphoribosylanthranilate isomerase